MPQTYVKNSLYELLAKSYPEKKVVEIINEAVEDKLRRDGFLRSHKPP